MRSTEFVTEAEFDPEIRVELKRQGYRFLGSGVDQQAYLAPDGTVMKIFGTNMRRQGSTKLTRAQQAFKHFADFCRANPNNPFLPEFDDWNMFHYKNRPYLQIKTERLFEFDGDMKPWAQVLVDMSRDAVHSKTKKYKEQWLQVEVFNRGIWPNSAPQELVVHLGARGFNQLWDTIHQLGQLAQRRGIIMDLHAGNFMLGSDGHIVISDPFFTGFGSAGSDW